MLALQPWTTYELAKQMEVSLHNFWPRAERKLYEEPKKLVAQGLAEMTRERVGRRPRTVYRITAKGREALEQWLAEPDAMPVLEFEALVKVFFAKHGTKAQLLDALRRILDAAEHRKGIDAHWAVHYLAIGGRFPERLPVVTLVGRLQCHRAGDQPRNFDQFLEVPLAPRLGCEGDEHRRPLAGLVPGKACSPAAETNRHPPLWPWTTAAERRHGRQDEERLGDGWWKTGGCSRSLRPHVPSVQTELAAGGPPVAR